MEYRKLGHTGAQISAISLGGHEYLPDQRSRGFNEDFARAVTPGQIFDGFGQELRKAVLKAAYDHGINFYDVTIDSEKDALGRNLREMPPPFPIFIQTRPEGMGYAYDENNVKMAKYDLLKAEVVRILGLLRREAIDILNLPFLQSALDHDPEYLHKIADNVQRLKAEGLVRWVCCDNFSGEATYVRQIDTGCFDSVFINFSFGDNQPERVVLPRAAAAGLGVVTREVLMKSDLFQMAAQAGIEDFNALARASVKWNLAHPEVTTVVYGAAKADYLVSVMAALESPELDEYEAGLLERARQTDLFMKFQSGKKKEFVGS